MKNLFCFRLILLSLILVQITGCDPEPAGQQFSGHDSLPQSTDRQPLPLPTSGINEADLNYAPSFPATVKDYRGQDIEIVNQPQRIISLLPSHTETLFALGAGDQMVGCTSLCNYPPETKGLKKITIANPGKISLEALVELQPDLVLTGGDYHREISEQLTRLKIPVLSFESQSLLDIKGSIRGIAAATGHADKAELLVYKIEREIQAIQDQLKPYQKKGKPLVFYQVWNQPLMTAGPTSFIGALIKLAGGENIFADVKIAYPQVSEETLILRNPDVILIPQLKEGSTDPAATLLKLSQRPGWKQMNAVKNKRVYLIEDDLISRPGPRVVQGLQKIAQALYPEAFQEQ
ncbi:MAG: cobalamin-binding protein [Planctomycetes bacterium]|nr:cobalamin-binding protein [Planctomycetota bacterium]MCH9727615.1 cobalamin-binding protein [Planctomycetota bacterium]MCH9777405.1 cobalamin-binding protein [Planctomycetota bacterium]MCH9791259.1 cobalamin-binding protein [Planctomycetota bacterium]